MSNPIHIPQEDSPAQAVPESSAVLPATPLAKAFGGASISASLTAYRGKQTVQEFSGTSEEVDALLTGAGLYDLGWRGFLRCAGKDRVRWLNNMVTNSVKSLDENAGCYAFVLNAKGRIQGDLNIYFRSGDPEALWLQTDDVQIEPLTGIVRRYIIMDQVTLEPQTAWTALGIAGPQTAKKLKALGISIPEEPPVHLTETFWQDEPVIVVAAYSPLVPRFEIWIDSNAVLELWNALTDGGILPCGANAMEHLRILEGTPAYGIDISDRDLPQETNQMRALNFTKGCYLGQEIVERIRSRGNVHRTLSGFQVAGDPPLAKTPILAEEKSVGEITSSVRVSIPKIGERVLALGYIRREALDAKASLTADGNAVSVCTLPFDFTISAARP